MLKNMQDYVGKCRKTRMTIRNTSMFALFPKANVFSDARSTARTHARKPIRVGVPLHQCRHALRFVHTGMYLLHKLHIQYLMLCINPMYICMMCTCIYTCMHVEAKLTPCAATAIIIFVNTVLRSVVTFWYAHPFRYLETCLSNNTY